MTETSTALQVSLTYFHTWTGGDFPAAMRFIAPDIVCRTPGGVINGADAFADFMGPFAGLVTGVDLLAAYGDDDSALIMYDTATVPVADAPGAELHTVVAGRITALKIIFDRLPFTQVVSADPTQQPSS